MPTKQSVNQQLEQARLNFVSDLHKIIVDVVKDKEKLLSDIIRWKHKELNDNPYSTNFVTSFNGSHDIQAHGMVSLDVVTNGTGTVSVKINGNPMPYPVGTTPSHIVVGNPIVSITVTGLNSGSVYATLFNEKASLLF